MLNRFFLTVSLALVAGTGAYMSVYGLAAVFAACLPVVVCLGLGLELGKLMTVVHLHRRWQTLPALGRTFYMAVAAVLMVITASEAAGFLLQSYTRDTARLAVDKVAQAKLAAEADLLARRIAVIDDTLAGLPEGYVSRRIAEREKAGYTGLQDRLLTVTQKQQNLQVSITTQEKAAGPVIALAGLAGIAPERAAAVFILLLVCVMEPLGLGLAVATSAAWPATVRKVAKTAEISPAAEAAKPAEEARPKTAETRPTRASSGTAENGQSGQNENEPPAETISAAQAEFLAIVRRHDLTAEMVADITGRRKLKTVSGWLSDQGPDIPVKQLRILRRWSDNQPKIRMVVQGGPR